MRFWCRRMGNGPFLCGIIHCLSETNISTSCKALQSWQGASLSHVLFPASFSPPTLLLPTPRNALLESCSFTPQQFQPIALPISTICFKATSFFCHGVGCLSSSWKENGEAGGAASQGGILGWHPTVASLPFLCTQAMQPGGGQRRYSPASETIHWWASQLPQRDSNSGCSFILFRCSVSCAAPSEPNAAALAGGEEGSWRRRFALLTQVLLPDFKREFFFLSRDCLVGSIVT